MKNLFLHNRIHVDNILANQNYPWLGDRRDPAMMNSSNQSSLRNIAICACIFVILPRDI
jgi:hypothetical protein